MLILVQTTDGDTLEIEIEEDSTISYVIAMVSSIKNYPPDQITITVDDKVITPSTIVSSLDLGKILMFKANFEQDNDKFITEMFDPKQQEAIMQQIHREQIEHNLQYAYQNTPEAFISYSLLFIECRINNISVKAMIDTGAQISVLPLSLAQQCHVDYLIDQRFSSTTVGVGVQKSIGRIHALNVQVGGQVWTNPFTILEGPLNHCILGVDWLTKNRAIVDVAARVLHIGGISVPFIEMPKN